MLSNQRVTMNHGKQAETTNNVLHAYKRILGFYYSDVSLETIQSVLGVHTIDMEDIYRSAKDFGLTCEMVSLDEEIVEAHLLPCIAYGKDKAVAIVTALEKGMVTLYDVHYGIEEIVDMATLQKRFSVLLVFYKPDVDETILKHDETSKTWFWSHLFDAKAEIVRIGILTFFINLFVIIVPMYTMNVYNRVIPNFATDTLIVLTIGVVFIYLFDALFKMARVYMLETMGKRIGSILEEEILKRLMLLQTEHDRLLAGKRAD